LSEKAKIIFSYSKMVRKQFKTQNQRKAVMAKLHSNKPQGWINYSYKDSDGNVKVASCPHKYFEHNQGKLQKQGYKLVKVMI